MKIDRPAGYVLPLCLFASLAFSAASAAHEPKTTPANPPKTTHADASKELHRIMAHGSSMANAMPMSGDVDKDFAMMMTMHHQQALEMADVLIEHGKSAELKAMARKMKQAQQAEIEQLARFAGPMDHGKMKMDAQHAAPSDAEFARLDGNKDGRLSRREVPSTHALSAHFGMLDGNKDGFLTRAEFDKHHGM